MKRKSVIMVMVWLTVASLALGCQFKSGSSSKDKKPVTPPDIPFLVDKTDVQGDAPATGPSGPTILGLTPDPGIDVVEQGGQYTLIFTSDLAGDSVANAVLLIEGKDNYFLLDPVVVGNIATATFTVNPDYPDGSYPILVALIGANGEAGAYIRLILHVAFVPSLEVVELYPLTTVTTPQGRREEALNVRGVAVFSKATTPADFNLRFEDMAGIPIPGRVDLTPTGYSATFSPAVLLDPTSQYQVIAEITGGQTWNNVFWTETPTTLGANASLIPGRTYSLVIGADNIVEPAAAQLIWGMIGDAVPPFLIMFTDVDSAGGTFSAVGGMAETGLTPMTPDTDVPVIRFANGADFLDPYFMTDPVSIALFVSVAGYNLTLPLNDLSLSGKFSPDLNTFVDGKALLSLTLEDLRPFVSLLVPIGADQTVCEALEQVVGQTLCDDQGKIIMQADYMVGNYEPGITELYDLVPSQPAPNTEVSAASPIVLDVAGTMEKNGQALPSSGWTVQVSATVGAGAVGSFAPASPLNVAADGTFASQLTIPAATLSSGDTIVIHYTCPEMPANDSWERRVEVKVVD